MAYLFDERHEKVCISIPIAVIEIQKQVSQEVKYLYWCMNFVPELSDGNKIYPFINLEKISLMLTKNSTWQND